MKKVVMSVFALLLAVSFFPSVYAAKADKADQKPAIVAVDVISWSATVKALDYEKKTVVLEDADGAQVTVNAKYARNFDRILVGDKVKVKYIEEMAVFARKADTPPVADTTQTVALAPKGKMPAGVISETFQVQADVEDINYKQRTITLKGPSGESKTYKVSKTVKHLKQIKKGDQVVLDVTQALALKVEKP